MDVDPATNPERLRWRYLQRMELEKDLEHRKTMEECRSMPNDRKYRKRMSNAVFNDIKKAFKSGSKCMV